MNSTGRKIFFALFWLMISVSFIMIYQNETKKSGNTGENYIAQHENLNQEPQPLNIKRDGTNVYINMSVQITDIEIIPGYTYKAWTFNGEVPGPLIVVNEGDTIHFTLENTDPALPHSMDFHAVHTAPDQGFADVEPNEKRTFTYTASSPGVFMYHCGTNPTLLHIGNGMHGVIIVKPEGGYPTDHEVDRKFVVIQNEWYKPNDIDDMTNGNPSQVVFSTKAFHEGQTNTNGTVGALIEQPFQVKTGEKIRFYIANMGPNKTSSFHVIGTMFDHVYLDGNPANHLKGMQTVLLPASGGAVVEFTLKEAGEYPFVSHQFNDAHKGAIGKIIAYDGDIPDLSEDTRSISNKLTIAAENFAFNQVEYVVKAGEAVTISFLSIQGYHGLSIDEFDVHIQGQGEVTFVPEKTGTYKIYCNIYCGHGHEDMTAVLRVIE